jgi:hypothetical protein
VFHSYLAGAWARRAFLSIICFNEPIILTPRGSHLHCLRRYFRLGNYYLVMQIVDGLKTVANLLSANTITMGDCYGNADYSKLSYAL